MRLVSLADCPAVPWKNGGGTTREIAVFPPGAGMDDFMWRLSTAQVTVPGAFSCFPGVDRIIAILSGSLDLRVEGRQPVRLAPASPPHPFPGDVPTAAAPVGGPVIDVNLMLRRGQCHGEMIAMPAGRIEVRSPTTGILARHASTLTTGAGTFRLGEGDVALFDAADDSVTLDRPSLVIRLAPANA